MDSENKIDYTRQAMLVFIKSLPVDSHFNIIRFGSSYKMFHQKKLTIEYNEKTAQQAVKYINKMKVRHHDAYDCEMNFCVLG